MDVWPRTCSQTVIFIFHFERLKICGISLQLPDLALRGMVYGFRVLGRLSATFRAIKPRLVSLQQARAAILPLAAPG